MSRGGAAGMGGERTMGGKGAHLGYCWWPAGRGSSRGCSRSAAASRRRAGPAACESGTSLDEQRRSRTGGRSKTGGARVGDE